MTIERYNFIKYSLREKCSNTEFFSGPYFPVFSPNTGKYGPEIHFSRGVIHTYYFTPFDKILK